MPAVDRSDAHPVRAADIAVVGMAGRFPGADSVDAFWRNLVDGVDSIGVVPRERFDIDTWYDPDPATPNRTYCRDGGWLRDIDRFDAPFFHIAPREADAMAPEQRLFLEVAWEALEDAGYAGRRASEIVTGVFAGVLSNEYLCTGMLTRGEVEAEGSIATGNALAIVANRVSYLLDLQGPSLAVDTACSSSLVATHLACQSLLAGECELAVVGGVNVGISLGRFIALSKARMFAPDGRCKPFDAGGNGYGCGEGVAAVVLKRLTQALQDHDQVYAVIKGSAVGQDGRTNGLTAPSSLAQERVLLAAYQRAGFDPDTVSYIEAHGTGTALGDPIELGALQRVFDRFTPRRGFCGIGSVKGNVGHLEGAAGIASLIKAALTLKHRTVVPSLHFQAPNPRIGFAETAFYVADRPSDWVVPPGLPRRAGVSSFGYGGTNCHAVLEEAPADPVRDPPGGQERPRHVLVLSAATDAALAELADHYRAMTERAEVPALIDICYTAANGRAELPHRLAVVAGSVRELGARLAAGLVERETVHGGRQRQRVAFLLGSQWPRASGIASALYDDEPVFRRELDRCAEILRPHLGRPLTELLFPVKGRSDPADSAVPAEPAAFAVSYCLARLWSAWGVRPEVVLGDGLGEYTAACVTGEVDLEDALPRVARGDWPRQSREPSRFEDGLRRLVEDGVSIFVEVGAGQVLTQRAREMLSVAGQPTDRSEPAPLLVSSLEPGRDDWDTLLSSLARLWCRGVAVDWKAFDAGRRRARVSLPTYPFERQRHWYKLRAPDGGTEPATVGSLENPRRGASAVSVRPSGLEDDAEQARDDDAATPREKQANGVANGAEGFQVLDALREGRLSVGDAMDRLLRSSVPVATPGRDTS